MNVPRTTITRLFSVVVVVLVGILSLIRAAPVPAAETTIGNNLSVPVIWSENTPITLRGVYGAPRFEGATATAQDGTTVWLQQDANNEWQAENTAAASPVNVSWVDWGDNLSSKTLSTSGQIRVETGLLEDLSTPMKGFTTKLVSGSGTSEMWGATQEQYDGTQAVVYSGNARLTIQRLTADPSSQTLSWDAAAGQWTGNLIDPGTLAINLPVWSTSDGSGGYAAEVSVSGNLTYGYNWKPGVAGYYRLTFSLDGQNAPQTLNTFLTADTQLVQSTETGEVAVPLKSGPPSGGGAIPVIDSTHNLTYIDVVVTGTTPTPTATSTPVATATPTNTPIATPTASATATPEPRGNGHSAYFPVVGGNWQSPMLVQNVDSVDATYLSVQFISLTSGQVVKTEDLGPLASGRSVPIRPNQISDLPTGDYSAVATSDAIISGVVNESSGKMAGSFEAAPSSTLTGSSVSFPNVVRNYAGWNSPFYVQNASSSATTVDVKFYRFDTGALAGSVSAPLSAGQTLTVDPASVSGLSDETQYSAVATSSANQPLVGVINQVRSGSEVMTYNGLSAGGTTVSLPNVTRNYYGWNTPFIVQNVGNGNTQVSATYYRFSDGSLVKTDGPYTLGAGLSRAFRPHQTDGLSDNTQYSVVIQSTSQPVIAVVNEDNGSSAMSYDGMATGGTTVSLPNVTRNYYGWNTPFVVQNVGSDSTQVTVTYYRFSDGSPVMTEGPYTLGPGLSQAFRPHQTAGLSDNTQYSVVVQSTGQPVIAVVNEENPDSDAMSYGGTAR